MNGRTTFVWITSPLSAKPVYHDLVEVEFAAKWDAANRAQWDADHRDVAIMACGIRCDDQWFAAYLRRRHADLFARPCRKCFPEAQP